VFNAMMRSLRNTRKRHSDSDGGVIVVYVVFAISLALIALAALTIDIGNGWQQQRYAQSVADSAALSGAQGLTEPATSCGSGWYSLTAGCADYASFYYALGSLYLGGSRPPAGAPLPCGPNCQAYTTNGKTVAVYTDWQGNPSWVHVRVCWGTPTSFGGLAGVNQLSPCANATARNSGYGLGGIGPVTGCATNDLSTTINNPIGTNSQALVATYNAALPIDPARIVFIAPDSSGNLVKLGQGLGGYTLTYGTGNNATISYTAPPGSTTTASLFVTDVQGLSCGEVAWSSCPVSNHDDFIETDGNGNGIADHGMGGTDNDSDEAYSATQLANSALIADADDSVVPAPGQNVGPGATLGAIYHDETNINPSKSTLFLNGAKVGATLTQLPGGSGANTYIYNLSYKLPSSTPSGWNSAFLYFWDADVTQTGGDCALTQWAFNFSGGQGGIALIQ
jgi:Putative Flp pilus-assembly TadE/G-like